MNRPVQTRKPGGVGGSVASLLLSQSLLCIVLCDSPPETNTNAVAKRIVIDPVEHQRSDAVIIWIEAIGASVPENRRQSISGWFPE